MNLLSVALWLDSVKNEKKAMSYIASRVPFLVLQTIEREIGKEIKILPSKLQQTIGIFLPSKIILFMVYVQGASFVIPHTWHRQDTENCLCESKWLFKD